MCSLGFLIHRLTVVQLLLIAAVPLAEQRVLESAPRAPHAPGERASGINPAVYPALSAAHSWVVNREIGVRSSLSDSMDYGHPRYLGFQDGDPVYYPTPSHRDTVICIPEKVGSSRWKALFFRSWSPETKDAGVHTARTPWSYWKDLDSLPQVTAKVMDRATPRFMWVRNPYTRLLSGFLNKICSGKWEGYSKSLGGPFSCTADDFGRYIRALDVLVHRGSQPDAHLALQVEHCGLPHGLQYDYFLKVEYEADWYPEFIALAGLADLVKHGWALRSALGEGSHQTQASDCFMELPGMSCEETNAYIRRLGHGPRRPGTQQGSQAQGSVPGWMQVNTTEHATGSSARMGEFFTTAEIVTLATHYVQRDLDAFGYPTMKAPLS
eukprot:jgi/Tetstr1/434273/TSEL_023380.t1